MALSEYGSFIAAKLKNRLADLEAVNFLSELEVGNLEKVQNFKENIYKIDLIKNEVVLLFTPITHNSFSGINRIKIIEIKKI